MTGFEEMWSQVHRLGVGVDHMPPSLSEALGDTAVNAIYQAVLDGKNPAEIGKAILNEPQKYHLLDFMRPLINKEVLNQAQHVEY